MYASRRKRRTEGRLAALFRHRNGRNIGLLPPHARNFDIEVSIFPNGVSVRDTLARSATRSSACHKLSRATLSHALQRTRASVTREASKPNILGLAHSRG